MADYKVLITTSGTGSRLGTATQFTNKSLVPLGDKAALSHIVEAYPYDVELVVTIGHFGNHVKDYLSISYPNRNITFVEVDNYKGPGSSLIYSMLKAKEHLQSPFIFHACDTIIKEPIDEPICNWLGGSKKGNSSDYRTIKALCNTVDGLGEKGESKYDYVYIGLSGIKDYESFWKYAEEIYNADKTDSQLSDVHVYLKMLPDIEFKVVEVDEWYDIGNIKRLQQTRESISRKHHVLDKDDESIHILDDAVVKFFYNKDTVDKRIQRSKLLKGVVPEIVSHKENFYKYRMVLGDVLSKTVNEQIFGNLLDWANFSLWKENGTSEDFKKICEKFYYTKTIERINQFTEKSGRKDKTEQINDCEVPPALEILNKIPKDVLCSDKMYQFHGDFILENIVYNNGSFTLIDWRQDFGGDLENGDIYYDLSKMNHNLTFNHSLVSKGLYEINITASNIKCDILRKDLFCRCQRILFDFIRDKGFDENKVRLLTPIIWLNMSALHEYPLNIFLYYFGRYNLCKEAHIQNFL